MVPPCPLCNSNDTQKLTERDTATGNTSVLYYCNECACCAPPASWVRALAQLAEMKARAEAAEEGRRLDYELLKDFDVYGTGGDLSSCIREVKQRVQELRGLAIRFEEQRDRARADAYGKVHADNPSLKCAVCGDGTLQGHMVNVSSATENGVWKHWHCREAVALRERDAALAQASKLADERDNWMETARQSEENKEYYRGLLLGIASRFGKAAYIADDGSVMQDPLIAKVPELVIKLADGRARLDEVARIADLVWRGASQYVDGEETYFRVSPVFMEKLAFTLTKLDTKALADSDGGV